MPRLGNPITILALMALLLAVIAVYAEVSSYASGAGANSSCSNATTLQEYTHTGDLETDVFESATGSFVVSYEFPEVEDDSGPPPRLRVVVEDESGWEIMVNTTRAAIDEAGDRMWGADNPTGKHEFTFDAVPGSYRLDIDPNIPDRRYALLVEECRV